MSLKVFRDIKFLSMSVGLIVLMLVGNAIAQTKVVVIPLAGDDIVSAHDHDDRYFGFGHTLQSAIVDNGASISTSNVAFPNTNSPRMTISFGLPPGRVQGRPILVQIPFTGPANCNFVLSATGAAGPFSNSSRFLNAGWSVVGTSGGVLEFGPAPAGSGGTSTTIVSLSHQSANQLGPGASVQMRLVRSAENNNDTCLGSVFARGGFSVEY